LTSRIDAEEQKDLSLTTFNKGRGVEFGISIVGTAAWKRETGMFKI
jgi:hypothetical protein